MTIASYHAKYFAHELTKKGGRGLDRVSQSPSATKRKALEENDKLFQEKRDQLYRWVEDIVAAKENGP